MAKPASQWNHLSKLEIKGYKSICSSGEIKLNHLNVLIGANGVGKSNFISFFKLLNNLIEGQLQYRISKGGGPNAFLHYGRKTTLQIEASLFFGNNGYQFVLEPTEDNRMMFAREAFWWSGRSSSPLMPLGSGHFESNIEFGHQRWPRVYQYVVPAIQSWRVYHFHDTSETARVKDKHGINDNAYLRPDASNLAAYLYLLKDKHSDHYKRIVDTVRLVAPFFDDFHLRPIPNDENQIQLEWTERNSDYPFLAHHLSDGTLRFMCLATLLLQPDENMPASILIDEPELGLHPYAIQVLAALIKSAAESNQVIVSTQSVELVNEFCPEDLLIVDKKDNESKFTRPDTQRLQTWLEDYSLGELWKTNLIGGRPSR